MCCLGLIPGSIWVPHGFLVGSKSKIRVPNKMTLISCGRGAQRLGFRLGVVGAFIILIAIRPMAAAAARGGTARLSKNLNRPLQKPCPLSPHWASLPAPLYPPGGPDQMNLGTLYSLTQTIKSCWFKMTLAHLVVIVCRSPRPTRPTCRPANHLPTCQGSERLRAPPTTHCYCTEGNREPN